MKIWNPDAAMAELAESQVLTQLRAETNLGDPVQTRELVTRIFREHACEAALSVVQLAVHGANERNRLAAAQYVIDKGTEVEAAGGDSLSELVKEMTGYLKNAASSEG